MQRRVILAALAALCFAPAVASAQAKFEVKPGDVWVMAGDSITAQRQHSNYIEAFYRARFPGQKLQFRNSGIGGNTCASVLARFDKDVAVFKPTIISIELGMNDVGAGDDPAKYIDGMKKLIERMRALGATPVLISSSPVNDGSKMDQWKGDRCRRIHPYTEALVKLGEAEKVVVIDQYHPLLALWHTNSLPETKNRVGLQGDPVHPGPPGQLTMAATILDKLGVDREVSSAKLKADGTVIDSKYCKISDAKSDGGVLSFTRLDERGPWPLGVQARAALAIMPEIADLSRYTLTVTGLPAGDYVVLTDGKEAAKVMAEQLAQGWNMSTVDRGTIAERAQKIVDLITNLQGPLNKAFRDASKVGDTAKMAEAQSAIDACEAELAGACQPAAIKFEIKPVGK